MMAVNSEAPDTEGTVSAGSTGIPNPFTELLNSFRALKGAPRGFWYTNYVYWLDGVAHFGVLTLLAMYFHDILGMTDDSGHKVVSAYMALITGFMLIFGPVSDKLGVRKSLIVSVVLYIIGRSALPLAPQLLPLDSPVLLATVFAGLLLAAAGNGFMQPASNAGVRKFSDKETATMGYGLLYAGHHCHYPQGAGLQDDDHRFAGLGAADFFLSARSEFLAADDLPGAFLNW
jgi:MFS family permease